MKNVKKILAVLLTAVILFSITACGNTTPSNGTANATGEEAEVKEEKTADTNQEPAGESKEIATVKWILPMEPQEADDIVMEEVNKILRDRYSLELELIPVSMGEYGEKLHLMSTSNEDFDLCWTAEWLTSFSEFVAREALLPLDDLLETEAGSLLKNAMPEGHTNVSKVSGITYAIPNYQIQYKQWGFFIPTELIEKYSVDVNSIKSLADLEPFMDNIRDNEPDMWALYAAANGTPDMWVNPGTFDEPANKAVGVYFNDKDFKVYNYNDIESVDASRRAANEYFKKGYIRSDQASALDESADLSANRYAIYINTAKPGGDAERSQAYGIDFTMIPYGPMYKGFNAGMETMTAINVNSKNPEAAIKMLGVMWTDPEVYNMVIFGLEGVHYNKVGEERVEQIPDSGYTGRSSCGWMCGNQFLAYRMPGQADDVWEQTKANNEAATVSGLTGFTFDSSAVATEMAQISAVSAEMERGFIWADDYDQWKEEYNEKLYLAGLETVINEVQRQIDEWRAANGK